MNFIKKCWREKKESPLPNPGKYEEMSKEAKTVLTPDLFDGFRFDFTKPFSPKFALTHNILMGNSQIPAHYEFQATYADNDHMLFSRIDTGGHMMTRTRHAINETVEARTQGMFVPEPHQSQASVEFDIKGTDNSSHIAVGTGGIVGLSFLQSVSPSLALGAEAVYSGKQRASMLSWGARFQRPGYVATATLASNMNMNASYCHKVSEKVALATEITANLNSHESVASVGYEFTFRQALCRGHIDSTGRIGGYYEEKVNVGANILFSGEIDHTNKQYKFGFGLVIGQ